MATAETRRADLRLALLAVAPAGLLGLAFGLGKIVRDCSLTCNVGYELAPLAILAVALVTLPLSSLRVRLETRWGYWRWQVASAVAAAASFFAFRALTWVLLEQQRAAESARADPGPWIEALRFAYLAFFVWVGAVLVILGANAYAHIGRLFRGASEEKALGHVAVAAVLGGLLGSTLAERSASFAISRFGWRFEIVRDNLMLGMGLAVLLLIPVVRALSGRIGAEDAPAADAPGPRLGTALRWIREDERLRRIGLLLLAGGVADTVGRYLFYWLVSEQFQPDPRSGRTLYFATFYAWLNGASLVMLAFGTSRLIRHAGLLLTLVSLPVALSLGTAFLTLNTLLIVMYVLRVVEAAMHASLYDPALERLHLGVEDARRRLARPILNGLVARAGEALGAVLVLGLSLGLRLSLRQVLWCYLAVLLAWAGAALFAAAPERTRGLWK